LKETTEYTITIASHLKSRARHLPGDLPAEYCFFSYYVKFLSLGLEPWAWGRQILHILRQGLGRSQRLGHSQGLDTIWGQDYQSTSDIMLKSTYYSCILLNAYCYPLFPKLCQHYLPNHILTRLHCTLYHLLCSVKQWGVPVCSGPFCSVKQW